MSAESDLEDGRTPPAVCLAPANGASAVTELVAEQPRSPATARPRWHAARIAAIEALWGEGFTTPGGASEALRLVKPLGLSSSATLLLVEGGLGGAAESISGSSGAWVASFEADEDLRSLVAARHRNSEVQSRVTLGGWDRFRPSFRSRSVNHAISLEALRGMPPMPLLASLATALRPQGQIVLTELVSNEAPIGRDREFAAWCRLDNRLPDLPRSQDVTESLQRLRFDVRIVEDLSERHIAQTLGGWREAVRTMALGPRPANHTAAAFVTEAELWLLRIRLMRRLGVRLMRWHAIQEA